MLRKQKSLLLLPLTPCNRNDNTEHIYAITNFKHILYGMILLVLFINIFLIMFRLFLLTLLFLSIYSEKCGTPPPAVPFQLRDYMGKWYEMGKYQTPGGGFFERDCSCTESDIGDSQGTTFAYQSCVKNGKRTGINATLLPTDIEGQFVEKFSFNKANYYVIYLDKDYAIEYDCQEQLGVVNYCVHIMARETTIDGKKLE